MTEILQEQAIEIRREILQQFHQLCKKRNLRYSLAYGTLFGTVMICSCRRKMNMYASSINRFVTLKKGRLYET